MATCIYCGQKADLFRKRHAECHAKYQSAVQAIPEFFAKVASSSLTAARFAELLTEAALAAHVKPEEFRQLSVTGVGRMIDVVLSEHLMTLDEEDRLYEIADAFELKTYELAAVEERLTKNAVLREIEAGRRPDFVTVDGPLPVELGDGETIIWILNGAKLHRHPSSKDKEAVASFAKPKELLSYVPFGDVSLPPIPVRTLALEGVVDLVITSENIFVISEARNRQFPFSRIADFEPFSDGFGISRRSDNKPTAFQLNDPWFACNLVLFLMRKHRGVQIRSVVEAAAGGPQE